MVEEAIENGAVEGAGFVTGKGAVAEDNVTGGTVVINELLAAAVDDGFRSRSRHTVRYKNRKDKQMFIIIISFISK